MKKKLLSLLAISGLFALSAAAQETFKDGIYTYTTTGATTVELTKADSKDANNVEFTSYTIPAEATNADKTYTVTSIGDGVFNYKKAETVTLPETIESLGVQSMALKNMKTITLPSKLKVIGGYAFYGAGLTTVEIPASVKEIGNSAFATCKSLTSITFNDGLETLGGSAFYNSGLTSVTLPESLTEIGKSLFLKCKSLTSVKLPSKLSVLPAGVFNDCSMLTEIDIPAGVKEIGDECFLNCTALTKVKISALVEKLGTSVFAKTALTAIDIDPANPYFHLVDGVLYDTKNRLLYAVPMKGVTEVTVNSKCIGINGGAFWGSEVAKVTLPDGMLAIDNYAFCQSALAEINFPKTLTFIGEQGFAATQLTTLTLPENMPYVYDGAFAGCEKLTTLTIPSGVRLIYNHAFHNNKALTSVTCLGATAPDIDDFYEDYDCPFYGISSTTPLYIPKGTTESYKAAGWGSYFKLTEGDNTVLTYSTATPSHGATLAKNAEMKVDIVFNEDVTIVQNKPAVFLREGSELSGATIDPDDSWKAVKGDNAKTLRIWASDYDGFIQTFSPKQDTKYYLIIPAGVVKNAAGDLNEKIVLVWNGPAAPKPINVVSTTPANGAELAAGWTDMAFNVTFDSEFTILDYGPDAVLTEIKGDTEKKITPDVSWKAVKGDDANTLRIWAADYDGFIQTFKVQEGYTYRMEIPAGIVQNADGSKNEKIVIEVSGPEASAISGIAAGESVKAEARYNINGQRLNARQKGINIVRMSDGKTVKVVVK